MLLCSLIISFQPPNLVYFSSNEHCVSFMYSSNYLEVLSFLRMTDWKSSRATVGTDMTVCLPGSMIYCRLFCCCVTPCLEGSKCFPIRSQWWKILSCETFTYTHHSVFSSVAVNMIKLCFQVLQWLILPQMVSHSCHRTMQQRDGRVWFLTFDVC